MGIPSSSTSTTGRTIQSSSSRPRGAWDSHFTAGAPKSCSIAAGTSFSTPTNPTPRLPRRPRRTRRRQAGGWRGYTVGACVVWPFGNSAKRMSSALLARPRLKLLTRELLGRKGAYKGQTALTLIETFFFSQRLRSLRATVSPGGFVPSLKLSAKASQWRVLRRERKRPRAARKMCVW